MSHWQVDDSIRIWWCHPNDNPYIKEWCYWTLLWLQKLYTLAYNSGNFLHPFLSYTVSYKSLFFFFFFFLINHFFIHIFFILNILQVSFIWRKLLFCVEFKDCLILLKQLKFFDNIKILENKCIKQNISWEQFHKLPKKRRKRKSIWHFLAWMVLIRIYLNEVLWLMLC